MIENNIYGLRLHVFRSLKVFAFDSKNQNPFYVPLSDDLWPAMKTMKACIDYTMDTGKIVQGLQHRVLMLNS